MNISEIFSPIKKEIYQSVILTFALYFVFLSFTWNSTETTDILISSFYFVSAYLVFFLIGFPKVAKYLSALINFNIRKAIIFPIAVIIFYYSYIVLNGDNPLKGTTFLFPFFILFPTVIFIAKNDNLYKIDWIDFFTFTLFLLPTTLVKFEPNTNMPINGGGFDSLFRIVIIIVCVYSFSIVRKLNDVGFFPVFNLDFLKIAVISWLLFYAAALLIGVNFGFFKFIGYNDFSINFILSIFGKILIVFLHTAIFEELFFRGLLQNLLSKRIYQSQQWLIFWKWGMIILLILSILTGYFMKGNYGWVIPSATIAIFIAAYLIEKKKIDKIGTYTALAITSVIFGIVHFHAGSIVFVALASIASWSYGFTYLKTKNVFYAALVHALVNNTYLLLGIELLK